MPYSPEELTREILMDLMDVAWDVAESSKEYVKMMVRQEVYDPYSSFQTQYVRRGEEGGFLGSWDVSANYDLIDSGIIPVKIFSNPEIMDLDPPVHGTPDTGFGDYDVILRAISSDRRENLDAYIAEGREYDFVVPKDKRYKEQDNWWTRPRDYFTPALDFISAEIWNDFESSFKKRGISGAMSGGGVSGTATGHDVLF